MAIVQQQSKRRVTNVPTAIVDQSTRRVVYRSKSSDDDKIHWIASLEKDRFLCKHCFTDTYEFPYSERDLECSFYKWQLNCCKANPGIYLCIFDGKESELMMYDVWASYFCMLF